MLSNKICSLGGVSKIRESRKFIEMMKISKLVSIFVVFTPCMDDFDYPIQAQKLSNMVNQSRSRLTKIAIFTNHVDKNI